MDKKTRKIIQVIPASGLFAAYRSEDDSTHDLFPVICIALTETAGVQAVECMDSSSESGDLTFCKDDPDFVSLVSAEDAKALLDSAAAGADSD